MRTGAPSYRKVKKSGALSKRNKYQRCYRCGRCLFLFTWNWTNSSEGMYQSCSFNPKCQQITTAWVDQFRKPIVTCPCPECQKNRT